MASLLPPMRPPDKFPKPFGKQGPEPPENAEQNPEGNESALEFGHPYYCDESGNREVNEHDPEGDLCEKLERLPPERNPRLRRREFPAPALRTDFGMPGIRMKTQTEFQVVGPPARTAE